MTEVLNLADPASVARQRDALALALPTVLGVAGAEDQVGQLHRGQHTEVVDWLRGKVSVQQHGANAGGIGLTPAQTRRFNPIARDLGLMAPVRLWTPEDNLPQGAQVGDIIDYSVLPDYQTLPAEVFTGNVIAVSATVDGSIGRIDTGLGVAVRSKMPQGQRARLTVLAGMRAVGAGEGVTGLYRQFLPEGTDPNTPVEEAFPTASDAVTAILQARCSTFDLVHEVEDPEAGHKPADRLHPVLGGRTWIARSYDAVHAESGVPLEITVVNGEPIAPTGHEMNRSKVVPAPRAAETLLDYLQLPQTEQGRPTTLAISYAH